MRNLWTLWHCASCCIRFLYLKMSKKNNKKKDKILIVSTRTKNRFFLASTDLIKKGFICWMILCVFLSILGPNNLKATYQCLWWRNQRCWYGWRSRCRRTGKQNYSASIHWFSIKREARVFLANYREKRTTAKYSSVQTIAGIRHTGIAKGREWWNQAGILRRKRKRKEEPVGWIVPVRPWKL